LLLHNFWGPHKKKRKKRKYKKKIKNYSKKNKKYISGKRIPECLENSQRLVEEDKKIQRLKLNNIFLTDEGSIGKKI